MKDVRDLLKANAVTRYIKAQVGRPWDKVYSELCSMADSRSENGRRIQDNIRWNVQTDCVMDDDGESISYSSRWLGRRPVDGLFVHPKTGILSYAERPSYHGIWASPRPWEREINYISIEDGAVLIKEGDIWYKIWTTTRQEGHRAMEKNPETGKYEPCGPVTYSTRYTNHREQLNHKEIQYLKKNLLRYGTNKDFLARLNGKYIPAYRWKTV